MPFFLDGDPTQSEISEAVNYLLSNFSAGVTSDPNTGQITAPAVGVIGYLYQYIAVKYADSFDGSVNFSNSPTGRAYYGLRNSNDAAESTNPTDYIWNKVTGGFGSTKFLWYITTGGRAIQFAVATAAPDAGWLQDTGASIDLDVITSATVPVIAETFFAYFTPSTLQVPRTGSPLAPVFTNVNAVMFATDKGVVVPFTDAQTDSNVAFVNNSWRIGNSSTTGFGDISYTNITVGNPTDAGDYALWPIPTAMSGNPAYITVPVRYKNSLGVVTQAAVAKVQYVFVDPGSTGPVGSSIDISGYTSFVENTGGAFTPTNATLTALLSNVTSPTYSWTISGATPTTASTASVVVTPTSSSTGVDVTLTVNGSNLASPISKSIKMPVVYDGAPGTAGANGVMSAFPTIYIWTGSSTPPTRPSTTSTYTWSTGAYTAPSGWATQPPTNTTAGNYLWSITIPLTVSATTTTSALDWTDTTYPIRAVAYNGANGSNGTNGTNGAATFVVTRSANDSSAPTPSEVYALLGRYAVSGDICTVSYNSANNAVVYQYITSWSLFVTYITGSLIVSNTITSDKMNVSQLSAIAANLGTITAGDLSIGSSPAISGTTMTGVGAHLYSSGNFAFGNSTTNMVFNGSNVYLNGFQTSSNNSVNNQNLTQSTDLFARAVNSFNVSKPTIITYGCNYTLYVEKTYSTAWALDCVSVIRLSEIIPSSSIVSGRTYAIKTVGTSNFTSIGATSNTDGLIFVATGSTTGTGTVCCLNSSVVISENIYQYDQVFTPRSSDVYARYTMSYTNSVSLSPTSLGYSILISGSAFMYDSSGASLGASTFIMMNANSFAYEAKI